jgi:hypothetical protein
MTDWVAMKALVGRYVQVLLNRDPDVYVSGELVDLSDDGEVCLFVDGRYEYSWPALEMDPLD